MYITKKDDLTKTERLWWYALHNYYDISRSVARMMVENFTTTQLYNSYPTASKAVDHARKYGIDINLE